MRKTFSEQEQDTASLKMHGKKHQSIQQKKINVTKTRKTAVLLAFILSNHNFNSSNMLTQRENH